MLPTSRQFDAALRIVAQLRAAGHEAYLAGGCVRDLLLGREPKDYDVATSATPDVVLKMFPRTFAVGARFGVVLVATCGGVGGVFDAESGSSENSLCDVVEAKLAPPQVVTEVATFRSDGAYTDGRHPDGVRYTTSAEEDVRRRDFTINGMLLDPLKGTGFSPYINSTKINGALAPEGILIHTDPRPSTPGRFRMVLDVYCLAPACRRESALSSVCNAGRNSSFPLFARPRQTPKWPATASSSAPATSASSARASTATSF